MTNNERLTYRNSLGESYLNYGNDAHWRKNKMGGRDYEIITRAISKLADYEDAEEKGEIIIPQFKLGDEVWIVDRCGNDYSGYMFLAQAGNVVIVTSYINDYDVDETLEYFVEDTMDNMDTDLCVFYLDDCFATKEDAKKSLEEDN